ncbi:MAG: glycine cleavage system protein GcvH [Novosphingobium sp.]|uniref:glycine cleavage system protein GcvH n=1 Tax=Novosphingobium sp. TaxID=1874826 RepID=UPI003C7AC1E6
MPRYYTKDHEWIDVDGAAGTVGITDYAQGQLGDITFIELPETGSNKSQGDAACVVDSVKAASDVFAPVGGEVTEANAALEGEPELVNTDPEGAGWLFKLTLADGGELDGLMDKAAYDEYVAGL